MIKKILSTSASAGASIVVDPWKASIRVRHLGPSPLIEDNSVRDPGSTVVNARAAWKGKRVDSMAKCSTSWPAGTRTSPIITSPTSRPNDTNSPVTGRLSRVVEPRTVRLGAKVDF